MKQRSLASRRERPLIGITTSEIRRTEDVEPIPEAEPPARFEMALGLPYLRGLEVAGGLPVVMPPLSEDAIESLLDRFELAVARRADAREMPILAICRGTQALNVVRGGALHQHLPEISTEILHRQRAPGDQTSHQVSIEPGSRLAGALGVNEIDLIDVNSFHHQAIDRLGEGLRVSARAPDGTIEGIEDPGRDFLIGVQWHAETLIHRPYEAALFRAFVEACRRDRGELKRRARSREVA
jgi:putative glutamine amidotransferase